ncbi:nitrogen regulation protein NR(I) [Gammaproteobacteria bacterium]|jgi:two-component system, NtrC family, nitrogen regulation response regulator GlnG|nr:nitrogen regulation protein NR(I) [Gammaproteobacteria bacterium]
MPGKSLIWIIDDDRSIRWVLEKALEKAGFNSESFESGNGLLEKLKDSQPDAIISDIRMPGIDGLELLEQIQDAFPQIPVIIMTAHSDLGSAVKSYKRGAFEYLPKPFDVNDAVAVAQRAVNHASEYKTTPTEAPKIEAKEIIGEAPAMQEVFRAIGRLSHSNITVLIKGESGTGKELVAQALHKHSPRADKPYIPLNVAAIPKDLIESELFGHEKGAFTGATQLRVGRFEQADGGTLFLDEIGDMPMETQTRLLRVLSDGEFYRVGGLTPIKADVRVIAATHQTLEERVKEHLFREDLYHRLNVIPIHLPKLSDRREDIPALMEHFLGRAAQQMGVEKKELRAETTQYLTGLPWQGNVRQLENFCSWITVMASGREIHINDLPEEFLNPSDEEAVTGNWVLSLKSWADQELSLGHSGILQQATPLFEKCMIDVALKHSGGRKRDASELLGWGRNTLTRKIKELGMESGSPEAVE